jgi:hypothetical protein
MSNNKQSSVEWLVKEYHLPPDSPLVQQAKAMHKEEIINIVVWCDDTDRRPQQIKIEAEQYYNETYGGNK